MTMMICPKWEECTMDKDMGHCDVPHEFYTGCKMDSTKIGGNCPACIPYKRELQVGDRVRTQNGLGAIGKITSIENGVARVTGHSWYSDVPLSDLELLPPDEDRITATEINKHYKTKFANFGFATLKVKSLNPQPRYKWTGKPLGIWEIARNTRITSNELLNLCSWAKGFNFSPRDNLFLGGEKFLAYSTKIKCFRDYMIDNGYIEEVKPCPTCGKE